MRLKKYSLCFFITELGPWPKSIHAMQAGQILFNVNKNKIPVGGREEAAYIRHSESLRSQMVGGIGRVTLCMEIPTRD